MMDFWDTANHAFSAAERQAFNKWRLDMFIASEKVVCATHSLPDEARFSNIAQKVRAVHKLVCAVPALMK